MVVGDYVRTNCGTIFKIENMVEIDVDGTWFKSKVKENSIIKDLPRFMYDEKDEIINKSSPNIIDLIQVGDYVNGIYIEKNNGKYLETLEDDYDNSSLGHIEFIKIYPNEIKSIVTKEQFESIQYEVE